MPFLSIYRVNPTSDTTLGSVYDSGNTKNSVNSVFLPKVDHKDFITTQRQDPGSPDVVSFREGLSTIDGPTASSWVASHNGAFGLFSPHTKIACSRLSLNGDGKRAGCKRDLVEKKRNRIPLVARPRFPAELAK